MKPRTKNLCRLLCLVLAALCVVPAIISLFYY